jgi:hypothetical protein
MHIGGDRNRQDRDFEAVSRGEGVEWMYGQLEKLWSRPLPGAETTCAFFLAGGDQASF